jgi:hypothetical protein
MLPRFGTVKPTGVTVLKYPKEKNPHGRLAQSGFCPSLKFIRECVDTVAVYFVHLLFLYKACVQWSVTNEHGSVRGPQTTVRSDVPSLVSSPAFLVISSVCPSATLLHFLIY